MCAERASSGKAIRPSSTQAARYQLGGVVANNTARVLPHSHRRASVTGEVYEKDGMTMIRADDMRTAP
jgi:hypothetical protein